MGSREEGLPRGSRKLLGVMAVFIMLTMVIVLQVHQ